MCCTCAGAQCDLSRSHGQPSQQIAEPDSAPTTTKARAAPDLTTGFRSETRSLTQSAVGFWVGLPPTVTLHCSSPTKQKTAAEARWWSCCFQRPAIAFILRPVRGRRSLRRGLERADRQRPRDPFATNGLMSRRRPRTIAWRDKRASAVRPVAAAHRPTDAAGASDKHHLSRGSPVA